MLKYKITFSSSDEAGTTTQDVECDWVNTPAVNKPMIEFRNRPNTLILAVNPANIAMLELVSGEAVVLEDKIIDGQNPPD